jgi:RNA polymerase sigma factor (TIGR02999 family)
MTLGGYLLLSALTVCYSSPKRNARLSSPGALSLKALSVGSVSVPAFRADLESPSIALFRSMEQPTTSELTELLIDWSNGDQSALDRLMPIVDRELHRIAHYHMRREDPSHTLQTSALVNEAYLRLINQRQVKWQNRAHFFAIAAQLMRRILVDHARGQQRAKRGGNAEQVSLTGVAVSSDTRSADLVALDEALKKLAEIDPQKNSIVEMRYFGGLSMDEIAEVLGISTPTVRRHWNMAKAWLRREIFRE